MGLPRTGRKENEDETHSPSNSDLPCYLGGAALQHRPPLVIEGASRLAAGRFLPPQHMVETMKSQVFLDWMDAVGAKSGADVARILDTARNTSQAWVSAARAGDDVPIKKHVALAMSAVAQHLKPWDEYRR